MTGGMIGSEMILANVMQGVGNGNKDEFLTVSLGIAESSNKDNFGRIKGIIIANFKGNLIKYNG